MNSITLEVEDANLQTVFSILENLKDGLVADIALNGKSTKVRQTQYQPKANRVIKEDESGTRDTSGKYASASLYKQRLQKKK